MKKNARKILPVVCLMFLVLILSFSNIYASEWSGEISTAFDSGSGTQSDPYVIKTPNQLAFLAKEVNSGIDFKNQYFVLGNDIKLNDETFEFDSDTGLVKVSDGINTAYLGTGILGDSSESNDIFDTSASALGAWYVSDSSKTEGTYSGQINLWTPIGKENKIFEGYFDGQNHTVSGLYINSSASFGGLFGSCKTTLENIKIVDSYVKSGDCSGVVAGQNLGTTQNCAAQAIVCTDKNYVGGVVGRAGTLKRCFTDCVVKGEQNVAGIAGYAKAYECSSMGKVFGTHRVGGIIGEGYGSDNHNCADVFGKTNVGGICGYVFASTQTLATSLNIGNVVGESFVGAIIGRLDTGNVKKCYYLKDTAVDGAGMNQNAFGANTVGKTTADKTGAATGLDGTQIRSKESFEGFDFEFVWTVSENSSPKLVAIRTEAHIHTYYNSCDESCNICGKIREVTHNYSNLWLNDSVSHWQACVCGEKREFGDHAFDDACDTTCNVCDFVRIIKHSYSSALSQNQSSHWYECDICGNIKDLTSHNPGNPATETEPQICIDCGYVIMAPLGHTHTFSTDLKNDSRAHWYECACGEKKDLSVHLFLNDCDDKCNICGFERAVKHSYQSTWSSDKDNHWHECSVCNDKKDITKHTAGAAATENEPQVCTECKYVITAALGHTHKYSNSWSNDGNSHWHTCPCGDKTDVSKHVYDNNCDTTCKDCEYVRAIDHIYQSYWAYDDDDHWYECSVCHNVKYRSAHEFDNLCDTDCNVCGYMRKTDHKYSVEWETDKSSHWHKCECGERSDVSEHSFDNACDTNCNVCGFERTVKHSYQSTWSNDKDAHWHECSVCHTKKDTAKHTAGAPATENDPQICTECKYVIASALGHTHKYSNSWSSDEISHWYACPCGDKKDVFNHTFDSDCDTTCNDCAFVRVITHSYSSLWSSNQTSHWHECECGDKKDNDRHVYDNLCDGECNVCGHIRSVTHSYQTTWSSDKENHWHECSVCHDKKYITKHTAGAPATESDPQICTECKYVITAALGHTHSYSDNWSNDKTSHWHECTCAAKKDVASHSYDNSCDNTCNVCSYERTTKHDFSLQKHDTKLHWLECSVCFEAKSGEAHVFDNMCDSGCNKCEYVREIKHVYKDVMSSDESGHWDECVICKSKSETSVHSFDKGTVTKEPTKSDEGIITYKCTTCNYSKHETLSKLQSADTTSRDTTIVESTTLTDTGDDTTAVAIPETTPPSNEDTEKEEPKAEKTDIFMILAVVLGSISVVLLTVLIIMTVYFFKKKQ